MPKLRNTEWPKISIVTPSFNQGHYIEETILSVLDQNYPNLEYIIIDGGSTDNTLEIIKKYEKHLHYWISEKDGGHADALNKGFSKSNGEIMAWLNSDDKYLPWTFETVAAVFLELPNVNWIQGNPSIWDKYGRMIGSENSQKNVLDFIIGDYAWIQQESTFWRKPLWEKSGGHLNQNYKFMIDGELWSRFFLHDELYRLNRVIGGFRIHETNRSKKHYEACLQEMTEICRTLKKNVLGKKVDYMTYYGFKILRQLPSVLKNRITNSLVNRIAVNFTYKWVDLEDEKWKIFKSDFLL